MRLLHAELEKAATSGEPLLPPGESGAKRRMRAPPGLNRGVRQKASVWTPVLRTHSSLLPSAALDHFPLRTSSNQASSAAFKAGWSLCPARESTNSRKVGRAMIRMLQDNLLPNWEQAHRRSQRKNHDAPLRQIERRSSSDSGDEQTRKLSPALFGVGAGDQVLDIELPAESRSRERRP